MRSSPTLQHRPNADPHRPRQLRFKRKKKSKPRPAKPTRIGHPEIQNRLKGSATRQRPSGYEFYKVLARFCLSMICVAMDLKVGLFKQDQALQPSGA